MRKLLFFPAILGIGIFFRSMNTVADLIDTGEWVQSFIYIAFGVGGTICAIVAMETAPDSSTSRDSSTNGNSENGES